MAKENKNNTSLDYSFLAFQDFYGKNKKRVKWYKFTSATLSITLLMSCKYSNKKLETSREKESYALYTIVSTVAFVAFFTIAQWNLDSQLTNQHPLFQSEKNINYWNV